MIIPSLSFIYATFWLLGPTCSAFSTRKVPIAIQSTTLRSMNPTNIIKDQTTVFFPAHLVKNHLEDMNSYPRKTVTKNVSRWTQLAIVAQSLYRRLGPKRTRTIFTSLLLYIHILFRTPTVAHADHPLENIPTSTNARISLRPGITLEEMKQEMELRQELSLEELARLSSSGINTISSSKSPQVKRDDAFKDTKQSNKKNPKTQVFSDDEYEDMDFLEEEEEETISDGIKLTNDPNIHSHVMDLTQSNAVKTVTKFSGSAPIMSSQTKNKQVAKTVVKIVGPIFAFCFARETLRWNREQKNVDKGLEIMEQQRKEYLKSKKEEEDDDDDDDDDEDDDDDDEEDDEE